MNKKAITFLGASIFAAILSFSACAQTPPQNYVPPAFTSSGNMEFDNWRTNFAARAVNQFQKDPAIVESMLIGLNPNSETTRLNEVQPEFVRPIWQYIGNAVNSSRVQIGKDKFVQNHDALMKISEQTGVPIEFAISIWGMETAYGTNKGNVDVVRALATFAYKGRRTQLGETELLAVADILKNNYATRGQLIGSWAGAMGHTQFMPSSYLSKAIDGDNDGVRDIWNNPIDALASTLNFLKVSGWKPNEIWGAQVDVKPNFDFSLADGQMRPYSFWKANGIVPSFSGGEWECNGNPPACGNSALVENFANDWQAKLMVPTGANGPKFLVGANYNTFRAYNASDSYALSVALMGDLIAGRQARAINWPVNDPPIGRSKIVEVQNQLIKIGLLNGDADGAIGMKTRLALQAFQKQNNLVADGYLNNKAYQELRRILGINDEAPKADTLIITNPDGENGMPVKMKWGKGN